MMAPAEPDRPEVSGGDPSGAEVATPRPLLASEALMDDVAPVEPWRRTARQWCAALGTLFVALGLAPYALAATGAVAPRSTTPIVDLVLGALMLVCAILPLRYVWRATAMVTVTAATTLSGLAGFGPAHALAQSVGEWGLLHALAATGVPAALLFRARYRAYAGARRILGATLALALPFVGYCVLTFEHEPLAVQVASGIAMGAMGVSLVGFLGPDTSMAAEYVAGLIIAAVSGQLGSEAITAVLAHPVPVIAWAAGSVVSFAAASVLGSLGVFQLLATRHWTQARKVAVPRGEAVPPAVPSGGDWSADV